MQVLQLQLKEVFEFMQCEHMAVWDQGELWSMQNKRIDIKEPMGISFFFPG